MHDGQERKTGNMVWKKVQESTGEKNCFHRGKQVIDKWQDPENLGTKVLGKSLNSPKQSRMSLSPLNWVKFQEFRTIAKEKGGETKVV